MPGPFWLVAAALLTSRVAQAQTLEKLLSPELPAGFATVAFALQQLLRLVLAAAMGLVITTLHKHFNRERGLPRQLQQAQVLLCVAGALMMIIIGNSAARALGVAGGASIIRFRTPVEDPKDATLLLIVLGLGMSAGMGAWWVASLGTLFLCLFLAVLDRFGEREKPRAMMLQITAAGTEFPTEHIHRVLGAAANFYEPREVSQGKEIVIRYHVTLDPHVSLAYLSQQLIGNGNAGVKGVSWEAPKRRDEVPAAGP